MSALCMFYQSVVSSVLFYAAVCWGGNMTDRNDRRLDKLVDKASLVLGRSLDFVGVGVERSMRRKLQAILDILFITSWSVGGAVVADDSFHCVAEPRGFEDLSSLWPLGCLTVLDPPHPALIITALQKCWGSILVCLGIYFIELFIFIIGLLGIMCNIWVCKLIWVNYLF